LSARGRIAELSVLGIAQDSQVQEALKAHLGEAVRELRIVASSQEAKLLLSSWRPSLIVWRILAPTLQDISLAQQIKQSELEPPPIVYLHRTADVALLIAKLQALIA
jgi:CheY-like chemotaxis protein